MPANYVGLQGGSKRRFAAFSFWARISHSVPFFVECGAILRAADVS